MDTKIVPLSSRACELAVNYLKVDDLVALPTETVYGLAGRAVSDRAVARIFKAKGRPAHNPLICHIMSPEHAPDYVYLTDVAVSLMVAFWPGPLTLVLPMRGTAISEAARAGLDTLAVRCPDVAWRRMFLDLGFSDPLVMPSANVSGHVSPTTAQHVQKDLQGRIKLIVDHGACRDGIESTIVKVSADKVEILRPGSVSELALKSVVGPYVSVTHAQMHTDIIAPGMLSSHYAPRAQVRLNVTKPEPGDVFIAFGASTHPYAFNLSKAGDLQEAARVLYNALRQFDGDHTLAIAPIPSTGIGQAINDRLQRAAAPRGTT